MQNNFIIVLAWPEGMVAAADAWYDFALAKDGKYRVGHSALVLVDGKNHKLHYFDFGRYHTPLGFGRVRDLETDPDVNLETKPLISTSGIDNIEEILLELCALKAAHGEGKMYASLLENIDFDNAYDKAKEMQDRGLISYGPLTPKGTNCSRFVAAVMRAGKPSWHIKLRLRYPFTLSPSPKRNVAIANPNYYITDSRNCEQINKSFIKAYFSSIERK